MPLQSRVAIIAGYGTGISAAVARKFGTEGFKLALLARTRSRLDTAAAELAEAGITAKGYSVDLSNSAAVTAVVAAVHSDLGPINVLHWNPFGKPAGVNSTRDELVADFDTAVTGLLSAVQAAQKDLKATRGSVLVTGGGFSLENDYMVQLAVDWPAINLAIAKAGQRKLVHILSKGLRKDGIYAAEVTVLGAVKGTLADPEGKSELTAESIAVEFWALHQKQDPKVWFVYKD